MKRILLITCIILTTLFSVNAQQIDITNNTNCTVYFTLLGDVTSGCTDHNYFSQPLSIGPSTGPVSWNPATVPGGMKNLSSTYLTATDFINVMVIRNSNPAFSCFLDNVRMSNCNTSATHYTLDNNCNDECTLDITWTGGTTITVVINP